MIFSSHVTWFSILLHLICTWVVTLDFYTWFCVLPCTSFRKWYRKHTTLDFLTFCHLISCTLDYIRCTLEIKNQVRNSMFFYTWFLSFWYTWFVNTFTWFYQVYTWFKSSVEIKSSVESFPDEMVYLDTFGSCSCKQRSLPACCRILVLVRAQI